MAEFRSRIRFSFLVVLLIAVATVSMVVDRRALRSGGRDVPAWAGPVVDAAVPVRKALALPVDLVRGAWSRYVALIGVREESERLRHELARLEEENLQLREALVASGRLERIAEMRDDFDVPMLPAELVGSDVSPWFRSVLLDRGRSDGVRSGMPVISEQGLVGLVTATSGGAAKTMLLLDRQTAIDGTVQRSRARGIVRGRGDERLEFEFVARGGDVQLGDLVITSGLGGVYPKGLLIGRVSAVSEPGTKLLSTASLEPAVDFGRLEQAFVMLRRGPTMELLYTTEAGDEGRVASEQDPKP
jgi:rod shape-determining protein MreC